MKAEERKAWSLECCWVCHQTMMVPLHSISLRCLGMHKVHQACFSDALYSRFATSNILIVGVAAAAERSYGRYGRTTRFDPPDLQPDPLSPDRMTLTEI